MSARDEDWVGLMMGFLRTGEGFDTLWGEIFPFVESTVRSRLRKVRVGGRFTRDDEAAVDDAETRQIVNDCVDLLADEAMRNVVCPEMREGLSEQQIAARTGLNVTMVHRRLNDSFGLLVPALARRGIGPGWLGEAVEWKRWRRCSV